MNKISFAYSLTLLLSVALATITRANEDIFTFQEYVNSDFTRAQGSGSCNGCQMVTIPVSATATACVAQCNEFTITVEGTANCSRTGTRAPVVLPAGSIVVYFGTFNEVDFISAQSTAGSFNFTPSSITEQANNRKFIALVNQAALMAGQTFTITARLRAPKKSFNLFTNVGIGANPGSDFMTITSASIRLLTAVGNPRVSCDGSSTGSSTATLMCVA